MLHGAAKEMENISAYFWWIGIPAFLPVTVNLPGIARWLASVPRAPLANCRMRVLETRVWAEVNGRCRHASRQLRAAHPVIACEWFRYFGPDLHHSLPEIQSHVPPRSRQPGGSNERPYFSTRRGYESRQILRRHPASNHSGWDGLAIGQFDLIFGQFRRKNIPRTEFRQAVWGAATHKHGYH